ncbi:hypothetical protein M5D96_002619, partial [Drosophila gunungcola]
GVVLSFIKKTDQGLPAGCQNFIPSAPHKLCPIVLAMPAVEDFVNCFELIVRAVLLATGELHIYWPTFWSYDITIKL